MKRHIFGLLVAALVWTGCPAKKTEPTPDSGHDKDSVKTVADTAQDDAAKSLDELVYEARGTSLLKKESLARSQSELKGRVALVKTLAEDAGKLIRAFIAVHPELFAKSVNADKFSTKIAAHMDKETTLKGSRIEEYNTESDTMFAFVEISLMDGYSVIEKAVVEVGKQAGYLNEASVPDFQKAFKSFFLEEKKKLLTLPS